MKPTQTRDLIFSILYHHHHRLNRDDLQFLERCYTKTQTPEPSRAVAMPDHPRINFTVRRISTPNERRILGIVDKLKRRGLAIPPPPQV